MKVIMLFFVSVVLERCWLDFMVILEAAQVVCGAVELWCINIVVGGMPHPIYVNEVDSIGWIETD